MCEVFEVVGDREIFDGFDRDNLDVFDERAEMFENDNFDAFERENLDTFESENLDLFDGAGGGWQPVKIEATSASVSRSVTEIRAEKSVLRYAANVGFLYAERSSLESSNIFPSSSGWESSDVEYFE